MTLYDTMQPVTPLITPEEQERDRLRGTMTLSEWTHYRRTGARMASPDPDCRDCGGTGVTTEQTYRNHAYTATNVSGMCRCVVAATRAAMAAE